jgi:lactate racemase
MAERLTDADVAAQVAAFVDQLDVAGRDVVVVVPDATRTVPLKLLAGLLDAALFAQDARHVDYLVALGTHQPMSQSALEDHLGPLADRAVNHTWDEPETLCHIGEISARLMSDLSAGMMSEEVPVRVNRRALDADLVIVCGPVFPHEVVGFSGGNKYFFPGISDSSVIDASHWLGALIGARDIIGAPGITPVRRLIDHAAAMIPTPRYCLAAVVDPTSEALLGLYTGTPEDAWAAASQHSARTHVRYVDKPYQRVLSVVPSQYDDMWTAAKGMYKVEPVVADGGEVIIYAPHITEFSATHGAALAQVGYHVRDYFLGQWERFADFPRGILAHSTHLRGSGTWSLSDGERPRITVTLATGIEPGVCAQHGLGYRDPGSIDVAAWTATAQRDSHVLVVPKAGEILYRLRASA